MQQPIVLSLADDTDIVLEKINDELRVTVTTILKSREQLSKALDNPASTHPIRG
jgi:hypothetical protein